MKKTQARWRLEWEPTGGTAGWKVLPAAADSAARFRARGMTLPFAAARLEEKLASEAKRPKAETEARLTAAIKAALDARLAEAGRRLAADPQARHEIAWVLALDGNDREWLVREGLARMEAEPGKFAPCQQGYAHPSAKVSPGATIGAGARIHAEASVGTATIGPNAIIGEGCVIADGALIGVEVEIATGTEVGERACIGARSRLGERNRIGAEACLGMDTTTGRSVRIAAKVLVYDDCTLGDVVGIGNGSVIDCGVCLGAHTQLSDNVRLEGEASTVEHTTIAESSVIGPRARIGTGSDEVRAPADYGENILFEGYADPEQLRDDVERRALVDDEVFVGAEGEKTADWKTLPEAERQKVRLEHLIEREKNHRENTRREMNQVTLGVAFTGGADITVGRGTWTERRVRVEDGATVGESVTLGANVRVMAGATVGDGTDVGDDATIAEGAHYGEDTLLGKTRE